MKKLLPILLAISVPQAWSSPGGYISVDKNLGQELAEKFALEAPLAESSDGVAVYKIPNNNIEMISDFMHHEKNRCGGFMAHETEHEALEALGSEDNRLAAQLDFLDMPELTEGETIKSLVTQVAESDLRATILGLSQFHNRHYTSPTGLESQTWLKDQWSALGASRNDFKVEFYRHSKWKQPSVVATLEGSDLADEIIVLGGHADSIGRGFFDRSQAHAPGADDNASGISAITEAMRIILTNGIKPRRTIMFMGYAAEEVGLLGSKDISSQFKGQGKKVINVIQFDMANYKGSNKAIYLSTDFTGPGMGEYLGKLIDQYVQVPWGTMSCNYGCSDHASWTNQGFPAILATEAPLNQMNKNIHTESDSIEKSGGHAENVIPFAKLAVAFAIEGAKSSL